MRIATPEKVGNKKMAKDKKYSKPWGIFLAMVLFVSLFWGYQQSNHSDNPIREFYCYSVDKTYLPDVYKAELRATENDVVFILQSRLLEEFEVAIPRELLPDYENNWNQFCHGLIQNIEDSTFPVRTEDHLYNHFIVTYTDGAQTGYETESHSHEAGWRSFPIPGFSQLFATDEINAYLEQALAKQLKLKREQVLLDLQLERIEPLEDIESIVYTRIDESPWKERQVITITPGRLTYEGYLDEESWAVGTPEVSLSTELIQSEMRIEGWIPTEWSEIISSEEIILLYHMAVQKGPAPEHSNHTVAFTTADGNTYSTSAEIDSYTFELAWDVFHSLDYAPMQDTVIGALYNTQIRLADYQKGFDKRSAEGLQPLPDLYSVELNLDLMEGIVYYIDTDLNVRIYNPAISCEAPVIEEKITQAEWEQLINSKGMLIAQNDPSTTKDTSGESVVLSYLAFRSKTEPLNWHHDVETSYSGYFAMTEIIDFFEQKGYSLWTI